MRSAQHGAMARGHMIDAKFVEIGLLLDRIEKMVDVHNLLLYHLSIRNGFEQLVLITLQDASSCSHCKTLDHV